MKIIDARWTPRINMLLIKCWCSYEFWHQSNRWRAKCGKCGSENNLGKIRDRYLEENRNEKA